MYTQEEMCAQIQSGNAEMLLDLWGTVEKLYTLKCLKWYHAHAEQCARHGVELEDTTQQAWFAFLQSVAAFNAAEGLPFVSYINYPFKREMQELLGQRTAQGRFEPLNHCASLDKPIETEDGSADTLADFVPDPTALDFVQLLDAQSVAELVRAEVDRLPMPESEIIARYFLHGETLGKIADALGLSPERIRQRRDKGLKLLKRSKPLANLWAEFHHTETLREMEKRQRKDRPDTFSSRTTYREAEKFDTWLDRAEVYAEQKREECGKTPEEWTREDKIAAILEYAHMENAETA